MITLDYVSAENDISVLVSTKLKQIVFRSIVQPPRGFVSPLKNPLPCLSFSDCQESQLNPQQDRELLTGVKLQKSSSLLIWLVYLL